MLRRSLHRRTTERRKKGDKFNQNWTSSLHLNFVCTKTQFENYDQQYEHITHETSIFKFQTFVFFARNFIRNFQFSFCFSLYFWNFSIKHFYFFFDQDLNRDFLSFYDKQEVDGGANLNAILESREHETQLIMRWILDHPFVLSANFHDGAVLANVRILFEHFFCYLYFFSLNVTASEVKSNA